MKYFLLPLFLLLGFTTSAQTTHIVEVGPGMTYTPDVLTIEEGDIVTWTSEGGTHDVNFDINSQTGESFGNPDEIASASLPVQTGFGEMGSITFDNAGTYNYDCSVGAHAANGMVGTIIVEDGTSNVNETAQEELNRTFHVFQSNYGNALYIQFAAAKNSNNASIQLTGLDGKQIFNQNLSVEQGKNVQNIALKHAPSKGIYIVNLSVEGSFVSKKISIQ